MIASPDALGDICDGLAARDTYEIVVPDLERPELLAERHIDGIISSYEIGRDLGSVMVELPAADGLPIKVTVGGITVGKTVMEDPLAEAIDILDQVLLVSPEIATVTPLAG